MESLINTHWIVPYIALVIGFLLLIKGADILIDGASSIAKKLGISSLMIGLTIVAFGTSAPEFFINIIGAINSKTDLALGNIVGSLIANTLLILGITAIVYPLRAKASTVHKEVPFLFLGTIALLVATWDTAVSGLDSNIITRSEGILLILFFIIFVSYTFTLKKSPDEENNDTEIFPFYKAFIFIVLGIAGLVGGGQILVTSATSIASGLGVPESIIGLTIVAIGTSLPELAASVIAALKRNPDIALGNIVGSNIYGIFLIVGSTATISNIEVGKWLSYDIIIASLSTFILSMILFFWGKHDINRVEGAILVLLYIGYIAYLFITQIL